MKRGWPLQLDEVSVRPNRNQQGMSLSIVPKLVCFMILCLLFGLQGLFPDYTKEGLLAWHARMWLKVVELCEELPPFAYSGAFGKSTKKKNVYKERRIQMNHRKMTS